MYLLLITDESKSYYVYIKDFNRFMCNKIKNNNKKHFCKYCLHCFSSGKAWQEHKENCLKINRKESVKLKNGLIKLKNYFKQLVALFKIYAHLESFSKGIKSNNRKNSTSYTGKYQDNIPCSFAYKVVCIEEKMQSINLLKQF